MPPKKTGDKQCAKKNKEVAAAESKANSVSKRHKQKRDENETMQLSQGPASVTLSADDSWMDAVWRKEPADRADIAARTTAASASSAAAVVAPATKRPVAQPNSGGPNTQVSLITS